MADSRCWTKDFVKNFINSYKEQECLWNVKSKNYTNKNLKNVAYDKLVDFCKPIFPEANREFVQRKIQSLRGSFRKEMRKVLNSNGSYTSALWYFKLLLFTMNQELPSSNNNTKENQCGRDVEFHCNDEVYDVEDCDRSDNCSLDEPDPLAITPDEPQIKKELPVEPIKKESSTIEEKKRKHSVDMTDATNDFVQASSKPLLDGNKRAADVQEYEATGICVAKKLERMDPLQTIYAESLINIVLKHGLLKTLGPHTDLCNNQCNARVQSPSLLSSNHTSRKK